MWRPFPNAVILNTLIQKIRNDLIPATKRKSNGEKIDEPYTFVSEGLL
jgi:hypothetical protein